MSRLIAGRLATHAESPTTNRNDRVVPGDVLQFFSLFRDSNFGNADWIHLGDVVDNSLVGLQSWNCLTVVVLVVVGSRSRCGTESIFNTIAPTKSEKEDQYQW